VCACVYTNADCLAVCVCMFIASSWTELILPMLIVWLLNGLVAVAVFISLFTFGEPVTKSSSSASVTYWRHRNQADVYLRRVCTLSAYVSFLLILLTHSLYSSLYLRMLVLSYLGMSLIIIMSCLISLVCCTGCYKCLVWSVALYAAETWTLTQADRDRIEALEMWIWRRMEKISWMDKVTNEDVLKKVNESNNMLNVIGQQKGKWIGQFLREIFEGRMKGKPKRGRKRIQLLDDLADGKDYASLKREAEDRSVWRIRQ